MILKWPFVQLFFLLPGDESWHHSPGTQRTPRDWFILPKVCKVSLLYWPCLNSNIHRGGHTMPPFFYFSLRLAFEKSAILGTAWKTLLSPFTNVVLYLLANHIFRYFCSFFYSNRPASVPGFSAKVPPSLEEGIFDLFLLPHLGTNTLVTA